MKVSVTIHGPNLRPLSWSSWPNAKTPLKHFPSASLSGFIGFLGPVMHRDKVILCSYANIL